jgi:hypothetical protein
LAILDEIMSQEMGVRRALGIGAVTLVAVVSLAGCYAESSSGTGSTNNAVRISFETGSQLLVSEDATDPRYRQPFSLLVTNEDGGPVGGVQVELSIRPLFYNKGRWARFSTTGDSEPDRWGLGYTDEDGNFRTPTADQNFNAFSCLSEDVRLDGVTGFPNATYNGSLDTEDTNGNGVLDPGEDINGNGTLDTEDVDGDGNLEPSVDATASPGVVTTGSDGFATFEVSYPKGNALWSVIQIRATADVDGTENTEKRTFGLPVLVDDISDTGTNPPGGSGPGPYGEVGDCFDPG